MDRPLIIETDIGRDPDDFFALCYLFGAGADIRAITVWPGDPDQVAVVRFLLRELGRDGIPVGVPDPSRDRSSASGIHTALIEAYDRPARAAADGIGGEIIAEAMRRDECTVFCCGPLQNVGQYLRGGGQIADLAMQGGFVGHAHNGLTIPELEKFRGQTHVPTFNLNGDTKSAFLMLGPQVSRRRFIGKNVCHSIVYDAAIHARVTAVPPRDRAGELLREGMSLYLSAFPEKKFHDPTAAACMLHPEIAVWHPGRLTRRGGGWGAEPNQADSEFAVAVDTDRLWEYIAQGR